ncbi:MAG: nitrogen regulation protein NR(II) [Steroidobacteraceae bacterium]
MAAEANGISPLAHFDPAELLDAQAPGLLVLDAHLCTIYANVGAQDLLGLGLNQVRGRPLSELFADPAPLAALLRLALERGEPCAGHEITLTPIAGVQGPRTPVVVDVAVTPLEGQVTGPHLLLELGDARLRQRIARENALLSRIDGSRMMARQLAHEIKNPLGGLRGAAQLLERELHDGGLREYTAIIINEADRLRALVDTMLGPSRPPHKAPLNIHEVCEHVWRLLRAEAPAAVVIERDYDPSLPSGAFDRNELIQALLNVARNALQAVGERGRIVLRTRALSNVSVGGRRHRLVACAQVEDDGPGVPPELQQTLFYPLVTGRRDGTGLGLSVAQHLVSRHDGILEYETRPGRTVFTLLLPLEDPA